MMRRSSPDAQAATSAKPQARPIVVRFFRLLMRFYPSAWRDMFGDEMVDVFAAAYADKGGRALARELVELPIALLDAHLNEWRTNMTTINFNTQRETSIARWTARLLSVLLALFIASLFAFNDDVRAEPSLPLAIMLVLSAGLLAGWYSERAGAWSGLLGAPILSVSFLFVALEENTIVPLWMVVGIAAATGGAYGLVGWLYASVNRYQALSDGSDEAGGRAVNPWLFLLLGAVTVAVLFFLGVPSVLPVTQEIQSEPVGSADMTSVIDDLRRAGAVVGVGSVPRTDTAFAVSGTELLVGQEAVWLFEYPTISAATEDARAILDGKLAVEGSDVIQRANVLLLFSGVSAETRALVIEALGPPLD